MTSTPTAPLIAGLIPPDLGPMPDEARHALAERARLIEERATTFAQTAIRNRAAWIRRAGLCTGADEHGMPLRMLATVAACRERYGVTGSEPLCAVTNDPRSQRDRDAAQTVLLDAARAPPDEVGVLAGSIRTDRYADQGSGAGISL